MVKMAENVHQLRAKLGDSEKITINLGYVDLGHIDLMVQEGFYSNRTDFIRTAIRNQLERHAASSRSLRSEKVWTSVCGTTAANISKRRV
jgi:Arc/MetJ-type ribon-helix-helix transcriptional regulator